MLLLLSKAGKSAEENPKLEVHADKAVLQSTHADRNHQVQLEILFDFSLFFFFLNFSLQAHLYRQIEKAGITYISIGHRKTLLKYHTRVLNIMKSDSNDNGSSRNWSARPINQTSGPIEETTPSA